MTKTITIEKAVAALTAERDRPLAIRPAYWRGSGEALVPHGGQLCRSEAGRPTSVYPVTLSDLAHRWQLLTLEELQAEKNGAATPAKPRQARTNILGRPSGSTVSASFPGFVGVAAGAAALGVHPDRLRRAVRAGLLPSRKERGVTLVSEAHLREFLPMRATNEAASIVDAVSPMSDEEVYL